MITADPVNILLVDDRSDNLMALEHLLQTPERNLIATTSPLEGLQLAKRNNFALALIDVKMPEMDGFEMATVLNSMEQSVQMPIIFVTATKREEAKTLQGYACGAVDFIYKPLDPTILNHKVEAFVRLHRQLSRMYHVNMRMKHFISMVSHDLREPLTAILQCTEMILSGSPLPTDEKTLMGMMNKISRNGLDLIDDILDLAALETGAIRVHPQACDLEHLVNDVVDRLKVAAHEKCIRINKQVPEGIIVNADPKRITQVMHNLIYNAIKFTPVNGEVNIQAVPIDDHFKIEVIDSGIGMNPRQINRLFSKEKLQSTLGTQGEKGTGLGLLLSQEIVRAHGSEIHISNNVDQGCCASFALKRW